MYEQDYIKKENTIEIFFAAPRRLHSLPSARNIESDNPDAGNLIKSFHKIIN
jgi:hypothetical protein